MNESTLSKTDIDNFWIELCFPSGEYMIDRVIKGSYLDFCRTLHGIPKYKDSFNHNKFLIEAKAIFLTLCTAKIEDQNEFDLWHQETCLKLIQSVYKNFDNYIVYFGQVQKFLNLILKYFIAIGEERVIEVKSIKQYYPYFHVVITDKTMAIFEQKGIKQIEGKWSRLDNYNIYLDYQKNIRNTFKSKIPMDLDFAISTHHKI